MSLPGGWGKTYCARWAHQRDYVKALDRLPAFVADVDDEVFGFVALDRYGEVAAELHVMAVDPERHRQGIGRALVQRARAWCREVGVRSLHVKTRGPSTPADHCERTRLFYLAEGFDPHFASKTAWGPENTALVLVQTFGDIVPPNARRPAR